MHCCTKVTKGSTCRTGMNRSDSGIESWFCSTTDFFVLLSGHRKAVKQGCPGAQVLNPTPESKKEHPKSKLRAVASPAGAIT